MTKKLILDLDTGIDDTLAIAYALGSPEVELIGIVGTYGNVLLKQGVRNDLAITDLLGHPEVKVYAGLPHALKKDSFEVLPVSAFIHGDNGIGNVSIPDSSRSVESESGVDFIIDAVKTYGNNGSKRRLNQMNLFFNDYEFSDNLDDIRHKLGF